MSIDPYKQPELSSTPLSSQKEPVTGLIYDWNVRTNHVRRSETLYQVIGLHPPELAPTPEAWLERIHPDDRQPFSQLLLEATPSNLPDSFETYYRVRHARGHWVEVWDRTYTLHDAQGCPERVAGLIVDLSRQRETEAELQKQRQQLSQRDQELRGLFDHAPVGLVLFDAQPPFRVLAHNQVYQQFFSEPYYSQGMTGLAVADYSPGAAADGILAIFRRVAESGQAETLYNFPFDGLPGGRTWWNWHLSPIVHNGQVHSLAHTAVNITTQVEAQQRLEEERVLLAAVLDQMPSGVLVAQAPDGKITLANRRAELILGYPLIPTENVEEYVRYEGYHVGSGQRVRPEEWPLARALRHGEVVRDELYELVRGDGSRITITISSSPVRNRQGQIVAAVIIFADVTERRQTQAELEALNRLLEQRVQERTDQVRRLALELTLSEQRERRRVSQLLHDDLQQELMALQIRLNLLARRVDQETQAQLHQEAASLDRMIDSARSLSRELSYPALQKRSNLREGFIWLADYMQETVGLEVDLDLQGPCQLSRSDLHELVLQLTRELLLNVHRHSGKRQARLKVLDDDQQFEVCVQDDGRGFDLALLDNSSSQSTLGLYTIAERVRLLDGHFEIESRPNAGTRVLIRLLKEQREGRADRE